MDIKNFNESLIKKFSFDKYNFYNPVIFDNGIGFSVQKKGFNDDYITIIKISIKEEDLTDDKKSKKPLYITATYGKKTNDPAGGVWLRTGELRLNDPIDLSSDDYSYEIKSEKFYVKNKIISPDDIINEIYELHIKPTKLFAGFLIRTKLFFWRYLIVYFFIIGEKIFHYSLLIISGDRYTYKYFFGEEILNDKIINSKKPSIEKEAIKENFKEKEKFDFLGYQASYWSLVFYSAVHFLAYIVLMQFDYRPILITTIFKNAFLIAIYVILSLWVIEKVIPYFLKLSIKYCSILSFKARLKKIRL